MHWAHGLDGNNLVVREQYRHAGHQNKLSTQAKAVSLQGQWHRSGKFPPNPSRAGRKAQLLSVTYYLDSAEATLAFHFAK